MSEIFRFFFFFAFLTATLGYNVRDDAHWFKDRERITDRFLVGMIKGRNALCAGRSRDNSQTEGVCVSSRECTVTGGTPIGSCSFLGTCCKIEKTCSQSTKAKLSYFVTPAAFQSDCSLTILPMNKDVCQIRLDFEKFTTARPIRPNAMASHQCVKDAFTITSGTNLGFENLCGENTDQHIYIPVTNQNNVVLNFKLGLRGDSTEVKPDWRIKIHQLECTRSYSTDINNIDSSLTTMHHHHSHHRKNSYNKDYELIAPAGCLQYYREKAGTYQSFNFNPNAAAYTGPMRYAICFKREIDTCGIRHTADHFLMNYNSDNDKMIVCSPSQSSSPQVSQDYIYIPGVRSKENGYYCDKQLASTTPIISTVPGQLQVIVNTDEYLPGGRIESGFKIQYELLNTGCKNL